MKGAGCARAVAVIVPVFTGGTIFLVRELFPGLIRPILVGMVALVGLLWVGITLLALGENRPRRRAGSAATGGAQVGQGRSLFEVEHVGRRLIVRTNWQPKGNVPNIPDVQDWRFAYCGKGIWETVITFRSIELAVRAAQDLRQLGADDWLSPGYDW